MRADRLLRLALLLQARGRTTAHVLADELEVSVRTIYRDLEALGAAGVPVWAERGPGGGCQLLDGYRAPFASLTPDEALAMLVLGIPEPLRDLGLGPALASAHQRVRDASGVAGDVSVHLDLPRWFGASEEVPHLPAIAEALRARRRVDVTYRSATARKRHRAVAPLGLVNKAGVWYAVVSGARRPPFVLRVGRVTSVGTPGERFDPPPDFDLVAFWDDWSASFEASRPKIEVVVRASPSALGAVPEVFGPAALDRAGPPDADGWREVRLSFEHDAAAVGRLAGFGGDVEVLSPTGVRTRLVETAASIIRRYR